MSWWIPQKRETEAWPALAAARERLGRVSWEALVRSARLLRELLRGMGRACAGMASVLERAACRLESAELEALVHACPLLPAEAMLEADDEPVSSIAVVVVPRQPPPIPAEARRPDTGLRQKNTAQERAWRQLSNGHHPLLLTAPLMRSTASDSLASRA
jgi:hypothetical protein